MSRRLNRMTIGEALCIFDFKSGCSITKDTIKKKFRRLAIKHHPDKGGDAEKFKKIATAYEVLLQDFDTIATTTPNTNGKPVKSVGSVFVDWLKVADTKNIKNPFTTYQKGRTK